MNRNAFALKTLSLGAACLATLLACSGQPESLSTEEPTGELEAPALATRVDAGSGRGVIAPPTRRSCPRTIFSPSTSKSAKAR